MKSVSLTRCISGGKPLWELDVVMCMLHIARAGKTAEIVPIAHMQHLCPAKRITGVSQWQTEVFIRLCHGNATQESCTRLLQKLQISWVHTEWYIPTRICMTHVILAQSVAGDNGVCNRVFPE